MHCPYCNNDESKVVDSRESLGTIRRRRECLGCTVRYTTYERVHLGTPFMVIKMDGKREPFSHAKIEKSISLACAKRNLSAADIETFVTKIERKIYKMGNREIATSVIGKLVMEVLETVDRVAYIRYASVYCDFQDEKSFADAAEKVSVRRKLPPSQQSLSISIDKKQAHQL